MEDNRLNNSLERIAAALERIAAALENRPDSLFREPLPVQDAVPQLNNASASQQPANSEVNETALAELLRTTLDDSLKELLADANVSGEVAFSSDTAVNSDLVSRQVEENNSDLSQLLPALLPEYENTAFNAELYPVISSYLQQRDIIINEIFQPQSPQVFDEALERIAWFIGTNYRDVAPFLALIKNNLQKGIAFEYNLGASSTGSALAIEQLGQALHEWSLLEDYVCKGYPLYKITARVNTIGLVHNFFSGFWFERYVSQVIERTVQTLLEEYQLPSESSRLVRNAKITVSGSMPRERDILLSLGEEVFWFECKSGDNFADSITTYEQFALKYDFDLDCCFFVYLDTREHCHRCSESGMHICSSSLFPQKLEQTLRERINKYCRDNRSS